MNVSGIELDVQKYAALQVAIGKFGTPLNQLDEIQRREAESLALKQFELQRMILSSDKASGVVISSNDVERAINSVISRYPNEGAFLGELEANDLSETSFREAVARELRVEAVMDRVALESRVLDDTDAKIYYYMHPEKFYSEELREASHILITINPDFPENTKQAALSRLTQLHNKLGKKLERFAELATKNSECPTAMEGGTLGTVKRGVLFPTVEKALFDLPEGGLSSIVESPMGYHLILCRKIHREGLVPIQKVLPTIVEKLNERSRKNYQRAWLRKLV